MGYREQAELAGKTDTRRFIWVFVAVAIVCSILAITLHLWNDHRRDQFLVLAEQQASREVFLERLGRPDDVSSFAGAECWVYNFNRNPYAIVCFGADVGDFLRSSDMFH